MPSTDRLVHHDLDPVTQANSIVASAFSDAVRSVSVRSGAGRFAAALAALDAAYNTRNATACGRLAAAATALHVKNASSSGNFMAADASNSTAIENI